MIKYLFLIENEISLFARIIFNCSSVTIAIGYYKPKMHQIRADWPKGEFFSLYLLDMVGKISINSTALIYIRWTFDRDCFIFNRHFVCIVYHYIRQKEKTGLWTSKTRSYFCLQTMPPMPKPKHSVEVPISICHWHAHRNENMSTHNSRAWINYWTWIRNSVDGQCTTRRSKCNVSNEKNVRCRCLWPHTSFCIQQIGSTTKKITTECDTHWRVPLCYAIHLNFFSLPHYICVQVQAHH